MDFDTLDKWARNWVQSGFGGEVLRTEPFESRHERGSGIRVRVVPVYVGEESYKDPVRAYVRWMWGLRLRRKVIGRDHFLGQLHTIYSDVDVDEEGHYFDMEFYPYPKKSVEVLTRTNSLSLDEQEMDPLQEKLWQMNLLGSSLEGL